MNTQESSILLALAQNPQANQRELSEVTGLSLGKISQGRKQLIEAKLITPKNNLSQTARQMIQDSKPKSAVILAAGFGLRMIPIHSETPKGLLVVRGEILIERLIRQLQQAGVEDISVVIGFKKEKFEYLSHSFGVKLVVNPEYAVHNNMYSLYLAMQGLSNTYIVPCDVWFENNPFSKNELYSWYMLSSRTDPESTVRVNRQHKIVLAKANEVGNAMVGVSYLLEKDLKALEYKIKENLTRRGGTKLFWEEILFDKSKISVAARIVHPGNVLEINTYEDLRQADEDSASLESKVLEKAAGALGVDPKQFKNLVALKKGMTNRSFRFECMGQKYIMRLPGEGSDKIINRKEEKAVYDVIKEYHISDDVLYFDEQGRKITRFIENAHNCDPDSDQDVILCMQLLREFHSKNLVVDHSFDFFGQLENYENYRGNTPSLYPDYEQTKENIYQLKSYVDSLDTPWVLSHIDPVPDNFLVYTDSSGQPKATLIDWEYAGMQDPHVDIVMFAVYAMYSRERIEFLIDAYFPEGCPSQVRTKIYCYIAICGLLWSNWCEYKQLLGAEFGEYSLRQYQYAKEYYKIAIARIRAEEEQHL